MKLRLARTIYLTRSRARRPSRAERKEERVSGLTIRNLKASPQPTRRFPTVGVVQFLSTYLRDSYDKTTSPSGRGRAARLG